MSMFFIATLQIEIADPKSSEDDICGFIFEELDKFPMYLPEGNIVTATSLDIQEVDEFE